MHTINPLVLPLLINIMEIPQHLNGRDMGSSVINNAFTSVLDDVFEKLESLLDINEPVIYDSEFQYGLCRSVAIAELLSP